MQGVRLRNWSSSLTRCLSEGLFESVGEARQSLAAVRSQAEPGTEGNFPRGVARPALRALFAAGLTTLEQLVDVSEPELSELHCMGPKAVTTLRAALKSKRLALRAW
jgi:hypothetical protein